MLCWVVLHFASGNKCTSGPIRRFVNPGEIRFHPLFNHIFQLQMMFFRIYTSSNRYATELGNRNYIPDQITNHGSTPFMGLLEFSQWPTESHSCLLTNHS